MTAASHDLPVGARVAVVLGSLRLGGAERQAVLLARHLHRSGVLVTVCGPGPEGAAAAWCRREAIPLLVLPLFESRRPWLCRWRMRRAARRLATLRPDVVASFTWPANVACARYRDLTGARTVVWGQRDAGINRLVPALEAEALTRVDLAVANGPPGRDALATAGLDPARITLVPNAVELAPPQADRTAWRERLRVATDAPLVTMIAHLHGNKDHGTLLRAWADVARRRPDAVLALVGRDDGAGADLRRLAAGLGIADAVRCPGLVDDIAGLLAACDASAFSSRSEGSPNGVLEAMAAGLAVAATDIPGIRWALGGDAPLAPVGEAAGLAHGILRLLDDAALRQRLGEANRAVIASRFAPEAALAAYTAALAGAHHGGKGVDAPSMG